MTDNIATKANRVPLSIEETASSLQIIPFAVCLPLSIFQGWDEPAVNPNMAALLHDTGIVGTITVLRKAVMIWFGWGKLEMEGAGAAMDKDASSGKWLDGRHRPSWLVLALYHTCLSLTRRNFLTNAFPNIFAYYAFTARALPSMGPLMLAMPRTQFQGAFAADVPSTKLVGGDSEDEEMSCRQMASRLSRKLGVSVFCSSNLSRTAGPSSQGMDPSLIQHRAAALAEKRVYEILKDLEL